MGLALSLFVPSVFVTMPALCLCPELLKGAEMLGWAVRDALHLYSAQGAQPPRRRRARVLSLQSPCPLSFAFAFLYPSEHFSFEV